MVWVGPEAKERLLSSVNLVGSQPADSHIGCDRFPSITCHKRHLGPTLQKSRYDLPHQFGEPSDHGPCLATTCCISAVQHMPVPTSSRTDSTSRWEMSTWLWLALLCPSTEIGPVCDLLSSIIRYSCECSAGAATQSLVWVGDNHHLSSQKLSLEARLQPHV